MNKMLLSPKFILIVLGIIILSLAAASLTGQYYLLSGGESEFLGKVAEKFNLDGEGNVPAWFHSSAMMVCAVLLLMIAIARNKVDTKDARYWGFIGLVFVFLSLDESVSIHEQATNPLRNAFDLHGLLFMGWVIPGLIVVAIFFLATRSFLKRQTKKTRRMLITAGGIYISGVLLMEMADAAYYERYIEPLNGTGIDWNYALLTTIEESLESIGICYLMYGLLSVLDSGVLGLKPDQPEASNAAVSELSLEDHGDAGLVNGNLADHAYNNSISNAQPGTIKQ